MEEADLKKLLKAFYALSRLCAPVIFKYTSSAGVTEEELKEMHKSIKELHDKYC